MHYGGAEIPWGELCWHSSAVFELGFGDGGAGVMIRWRSKMWELIADMEVGFVCGCRSGLYWWERSRDSLMGSVMMFVGGLRAEYCWRVRRY